MNDLSYNDNSSVIMNHLLVQVCQWLYCAKTSRINVLKVSKANKQLPIDTS